mmetsp:Transcript_26787/g.37387  ORF Transcript_26787/g.37387 Transcript_26787/m.37387 type:complete len:164 (-) Transcript_26787:141-632(-)|eukprot:CAMPEP_0185257238 /NCGR_PEP_ID=MMETSP1359-20130426/6305_1 /TAXON_ID=552665 /ORGANISM="Bigelowiella longifila, Strain CCMP242" /LENGTH=163 /DNA_ID=CAMNT_0027842225 /DNA_START=92 /DNA_END=583 /DNA_ORIENTATION=-
MEGPSYHGFPPNSKLERFHNIVETKLKVTLKSVLEARDKIFDEHSEYIKLRNNIAVIRESKQTELESLVNLGSEFYSQAVVPDPSRIVVDVGLTLHVEFTLDEAIEFCKKKEEHLKRKGEKLTEKASEIRAHIKLVYDAMAEIMRLQQVEAHNKKLHDLSNRT